MDLTKDIFLFIELAKAGSFQACADRLEISPSSVSRRLSHLEKELNTQLVKRTTRSLSLTETGELLFERCAGIEEKLNNAVSDVLGQDTAIKGRLRVGVASSIIYHELIGYCLKDFHTQHPELAFNVMAKNFERAICSSGFDVFFTNESKSDEHIISKLLYKDEYLLCAAPEYLAEYGVPETPTDLNEHTGIVNVNTPSMRDMWYEKLSQSNHSFSLRQEIFCNRIDLIAEMARAGIGIAILPRSMIETDLQHQTLHVLLSEYFKAYEQVYLTYFKSTPLERKVKAFIDFLDEWSWYDE